MNLKVAFVFVATLILSACADTVPIQSIETMEQVGFWHGLWHGAILPISWLVSLLEDETAIYAIYNNGGWYDFGFFIGCGGLSCGVTCAK